MLLSRTQPKGGLTTLRSLVHPLQLAAPPSPSQPCRILLLHNEILLNILYCLHDITAACLQLTCRRFYYFQPLPLSIADTRHAYLSYSVSRDDPKSYFCFCCTKKHRLGHPCSSSTFKINLSWPWLEQRSTRLAGRYSITFQDAHAIMSQYRYGHYHGMDADSLYSLCDRTDHHHVPTNFREVTRAAIVRDQLMIKQYVRVASRRGCTALRSVISGARNIICDPSHVAQVKTDPPWATFYGNVITILLRFLRHESNTRRAAAMCPNMTVRCLTCATDAQVNVAWLPDTESIEIVFCSWYLLGRCEVPWDPTWMGHGSVRDSVWIQSELEAGAVRSLWESEQGKD